MALFYCTFVALKARNLLTVQIHPDEFQLRREKRLFQAYVSMPTPVPVCIWLWVTKRTNPTAKSSTTASNTHSSSTKTCNHGAYGCTLRCGKASSDSVPSGPPSVNAPLARWLRLGGILRPSPTGTNGIN
jgi:hypothetical protein